MQNPLTLEDQEKLQEEQLAKSRWRRVGHIATFLSIGLLIPVAIASTCQIASVASGGATSDAVQGLYLSPMAMQVCAGLGLGLYLVVGIPCTNKANGDHPYHNLGVPVILACISVGVSSYLLPHLVADWGAHFSTATGFGIGFVIGAGYMFYNELTHKASDISYDTSFKVPLPVALGTTCAISAGLTPVIANTITDTVGWSVVFSILMSTAILHLFTEKAGFFTQDL